MDQEERDFIRQATKRAMEREIAPKEYDFSPFLDMTTREQMIMLLEQQAKIASLQRQLNEERREKAEIEAKYSNLMQNQKGVPLL